MPSVTRVVRRPMTPAERRNASPRFPWSDVVFAPLNGVLAAVPAVVLAGLPLYLILWLARVNEPGRWVSLLVIGAFGVATLAALYGTLGGFLRARARVDDDLLGDEVDDHIVHVISCLRLPDAAGGEPRFSLQLEDGSELDLAGDHLRVLERAGVFPSTRLRLVQLPASGVVVAMLPVGDYLAPTTASGRGSPP